MLACPRVPAMLPGQYSKRGNGASSTVALACPSCGFISLIDHPYRISDSGVVAPRWSCAVCDWADDLKLVDYAEAVIT